MIYKNIIDFIKGEKLENEISNLTGRKTIKDFEEYLDDYSSDVVNSVINDLENSGKIGSVKVGKGKDWRRKTINLKK